MSPDAFGGRRAWAVVALGEHRSHQIQQRPSEVMLGDHDIPVILTQMVDGAARSRPVRQRDSQGARDEFPPQAASPRPAVSTIRRHMVPSDSILVTTTLMNPVCARARR